MNLTPIKEQLNENHLNISNKDQSSPDSSLINMYPITITKFIEFLICIKLSKKKKQKREN